MPDIRIRVLPLVTLVVVAVVCVSVCLRRCCADARAAEPDLAPSVQATATDSGPRGGRHDGGIRAKDTCARRPAVSELACACASTRAL